VRVCLSVRARVCARMRDRICVRVTEECLRVRLTESVLKSARVRARGSVRVGVLMRVTVRVSA
jgi:hypothetical protein